VRLTGTSPNYVGYLKDAAYFTQASSSYWDGSYISVHIYGNALIRVPILSFDPNTDEVSFAMGSRTFYTGAQPTRYATMNHLSILSGAGQYVVDQTNDKIYLWPYSGGSPSNIRYTPNANDWLMVAASKNFITIKNFEIYGFRYGVIWYAANNLTFSGNTVHDGGQKHPSGFDAGMYLTASNALITGNTFYNFRDKRVMILLSGSGNTTSNNTLYNIDGTGIYYAGIANGIIDGNLLYQFYGIHGNGITSYQGCSNTTISNNTIRVAVYPITIQAQINGAKVINNVVDRLGTDGYSIASYLDGTTKNKGDFIVINNTIVGNNYPYPLYHLDAWENGLVVVKNNILSTGSDTGTNINYNCWFKGTHTATGDQVVTGGESVTFQNYAAGDYRLKETSICRDHGTNVSAYGVTTDILGIDRPQGTGWDMGAYEYGGVDVTPPTLSTVSIGTDGTTWTFNFSEAVKFGAGGSGGWAVSMSIQGAIALTYASGTTSNTLLYTGSKTVKAGETVTFGLYYSQSGNGIEDIAGNDLASIIVPKSVTNNSTQGQVYSKSKTGSAGFAGLLTNVRGKRTVSKSVGGSAGFEKKDTKRKGYTKQNIWVT